MRQYLPAAAAAAVLLIGGTAGASPGFGASSHRLGGDATGVAHSGASQSKAAAVIESVLTLFGFETAARVEPLAGERLGETAARTKQCDRDEKAEVAKAEPKTEQGGGDPKSRVQPHEPVYLAF
ncbi:MAG: hypothetical protein KDD85_09065 [Parvularculaceae bacterium]|nr:hypothetical protein [Parvularculaceae bacterium]